MSQRYRLSTSGRIIDTHTNLPVGQINDSALAAALLASGLVFERVVEPLKMHDGYDNMASIRASRSGPVGYGTTYGYMNKDKPRRRGYLKPVTHPS